MSEIKFFDPATAGTTRRVKQDLWITEAQNYIKLSYDFLLANGLEKFIDEEKDRDEIKVVFTAGLDKVLFNPPQHIEKWGMEFKSYHSKSKHMEYHSKGTVARLLSSHNLSPVFTKTCNFYLKPAASIEGCPTFDVIPERNSEAKYPLAHEEAIKKEYVEHGE